MKTETVPQSEILGIIPARGGSKSIPRKNIRPLGDHPLVAYTIAAGLEAQSLTRLIVSTDDEEIAGICAQYGAEAPFLRPAEFAQDDTTDLPVFQHALNWLWEHERYRPELIVQLRPTLPLRPPNLINEAVAALRAHPEADCVRSLGLAEQTPYKMWKIRDDGFLRPLLHESLDDTYNLPRQALPNIYMHSGHIDIIRPETILEKRSMSGERLWPVLVDSLYCVDIDTETDWLFAEWLLTNGYVSVPMPRCVAGGN